MTPTEMNSNYYGIVTDSSGGDFSLTRARVKPDSYTAHHFKVENTLWLWVYTNYFTAGKVYFAITLSSINETADRYLWDRTKAYRRGLESPNMRAAVLDWIHESNFFINREGLRSFAFHEFGKPDIDDSWF